VGSARDLKEEGPFPYLGDEHAKHILIKYPEMKKEREERRICMQ
jgi:hypothetical protein